MTQKYGCGFVNVTDYTVVEALLEDGFVSWEGENHGKDNGFKPKFDYTGKMWFIAADEATGLPAKLIRATLVPGSPFPTITLSVADLPSINEGSEKPKPNQITVDQNGVVYFPGGPVLDDDGNPVIIKAEADEDPFTVEYTITPVGAQGQYIGAYCVTLSKDHAYVATYATSPGNNGGDAIVDFDTATLTGHGYLGTRFTGETPYNMETDTSDSINDSYSYVILGTQQPAISGSIEAFLMPDFIGGLVETECEGLDEVVAVGEFDPAVNQGVVYTMERYNRQPGTQNKYYRYLTAGAGSLTYDTAVNFTDPSKSSTHHDIRREHYDDVWASSAISPETDGEIREDASGVQTTRHERDGYVQVGVACKREKFGTAPPI